MRKGRLSKMKIGFIDYFLDEWHANNYPAWIRDASNGKTEVAYAYGMIDSPKGGMSTAEWCRRYGIEQCGTIEEVVEKSDAIVVLSPDNCEMHEKLCQLPLRSGKPTYVDKTFAPDAKTAERLFAIAEESGTPCYSCSALRFASEYQGIDPKEVKAISCWGPDTYEIYSIHQLEPLMMLTKAPAKRVMCLQSEGWLTMAVEFSDGRMGTISLFEKGSPFITTVCGPDNNRLITVESDFFGEFIREMVDFFITGAEKVPHQETIDIMAVRAAGIQARNRPGEWVPV